MCVRTGVVGWRRVEQGYVVVNMEEGTYYVLEGSSALIWEMLTASSTPDQILERLVQTYDVETEILISDLDAFLEQLTQRGLICCAAASEPETVR